MNWIDKHLGGHWKLGPFCLYGQNAMHWAIEIKLARCYLCFRLPLRCFGQWWPLYLYISHNATPSSATLLLGKRASSIEDRVATKFRRKLLGVFYNKPDTERTESIIKSRTREMLIEYVEQHARTFDTDAEYLAEMVDDLRKAQIHTCDYSEPDEQPYTQVSFYKNTQKLGDVNIFESNLVRIHFHQTFVPPTQFPQLYN